MPAKQAKGGKGDKAKPAKPKKEGGGGGKVLGLSLYLFFMLTWLHL